MVIIIEDNWNLIKNVMLKHGWTDIKTLLADTKITRETINRVLRTGVKRGEIEREYRNYNVCRGSMIGTQKSYKFYWRIKQ